MRGRNVVVTSLLAGTLGVALGAAPAVVAQDATPAATPTVGGLEVEMKDRAGRVLGVATFNEGGDGVTLTLEVDGLRPGDHGLHLHEAGLCQAGGDEPYSTAGGHWNPDNRPHGAPGDAESHAGDFGNLTADEDGTADFEITSERYSLGTGEAPSVFDEDGTAIILHAGPDDLTTQPSGDSGGRLLCGIVAAPGPAPAATPTA